MSKGVAYRSRVPRRQKALRNGGGKRRPSLVHRKQGERAPSSLLEPVSLLRGRAVSTCETRTYRQRLLERDGGRSRHGVSFSRRRRRRRKKDATMGAAAGRRKVGERGGRVFHSFSLKRKRRETKKTATLPSLVFHLGSTEPCPAPSASSSSRWARRAPPLPR